MKKTCMLLAVVVLSALSVSSSALAEHTRVTNPNALVVEVAGRGLRYSVAFDRVLESDFAVGIGYGSVGTTAFGISTGIETGLIPLYFNYYFAKQQGSLYFTGGATLLTNGTAVAGLTAATSGVQFGTGSLEFNAGLGYENRSDAGFLFRVAVYGIYDKTISPWAGVTFGYSF